MAGPAPGWGARAGRAGYEGPGRSRCRGLSTCHGGAISGDPLRWGQMGCGARREAGGWEAVPAREAVPGHPGNGVGGAPASHSAGHGPPDPSCRRQSTQLWARRGRSCRTTGLTGPFPHLPARTCTRPRPRLGPSQVRLPCTLPGQVCSLWSGLGFLLSPQALRPAPIFNQFNEILSSNS